MTADPFFVVADSTTALVDAYAIEPGRVRPHGVLDREGVRIRLLTMDAGALMREHRAPVPILVQVVSGGIRFRVAETEHAFSPGGTIQVAAGVLHELEADEPSRVLLVMMG